MIETPSRTRAKELTRSGGWRTFFGAKQPPDSVRCMIPLRHFTIRVCLSGAASLCRVCKGCAALASMKNRLERRYGFGHLHFITCSCYRRLPLLRSVRRRDLLLRILDEVRTRYEFLLVGYVVMPEHIHLLISEPRIGTPSTVMQVLKQRTSRALRRKRRKNPNQLGLWAEASDGQRFWQRRFYDFNVWSRKKRIEKLHYMHRNPVKRGLVSEPKLWPWSSYRLLSVP
jgi:putative transposase